MARLGDLLDDILRLSEDQLKALPDCIWDLMVFANELSGGAEAKSAHAAR
jgi:hypothetical protein